MSQEACRLKLTAVTLQSVSLVSALAAEEEGGLYEHMAGGLDEHMAGGFDKHMAGGLDGVQEEGLDSFHHMLE